MAISTWPWTVLGERRRVADALDQALRLSVRTNHLETAARRMSELLRCDIAWPVLDHSDLIDHPAVMTFVEQWMIDVASLTDDALDDLRTLLGNGLRDFLYSLLVIEQRLRLQLIWQRLDLSPAAAHDLTDIGELVTWGIDHQSGDAGKPLSAALSEWQAAVVCLDEVDAITTELVRLRCANYHDCHT